MNSEIKLEEIKTLLKAGDVVAAEIATLELLKNDPGNLQAKMLYGTCRQFLGDEETFKRIHDELVVLIKSMPVRGLSTSEKNLWEKFHGQWLDATNKPVELETIIVSMEDNMPLVQYGCPPYFRRRRLHRRRLRCLAIVAGVVLLFWLAWWLGQTI